jgi:hypothetical protein
MPILVDKNAEKRVELTDMQRAYVKARANGMNMKAAAQAAGYQHPGIISCKLERNPFIRAELTKQFAFMEKAGEITKKKVLDGMMHAIDQAKLLADPTAQISGWREIAKICGYYEPQKVKVEVSVSAKRMFSQFEALSDEELLKIAEQDIVDVDDLLTDSQGRGNELTYENSEEDGSADGEEEPVESGASTNAADAGA